MVGYSFLDDSFIRNPMPDPGANQPCRLLQRNGDFATAVSALEVCDWLGNEPP